MTATEELRRMLDERGVEYKTIGERCVEYANVQIIEYGDRTPGVLVAISHISPEQAIEATLGRERTCTMLRLTDYTCQYMHRYMCSECGEYNEQPTVMSKSTPPNYCSNCGARVIGGSE